MIFRMAFLSKGVSTGPPYLGPIAWEIEVAVKKIAVSKIEIAVSKLEIAVNFYLWSNFIFFFRECAMIIWRGFWN